MCKKSRYCSDLTINNINFMASLIAAIQKQYVFTSFLVLFFKKYCTIVSPNKWDFSVLYSWYTKLIRALYKQWLNLLHQLCKMPIWRPSELYAMQKFYTSSFKTLTRASETIKNSATFAIYTSRTIMWHENRSQIQCIPKRRLFTEYA